MPKRTKPLTRRCALCRTAVTRAPSPHQGETCLCPNCIDSHPGIVQVECTWCRRPLLRRRSKVETVEHSYCDQLCKSAHQTSPEVMYAHLDARIKRGRGNACWLWQGTVDRYGQPIAMVAQKQRSVRRLVYERYIGKALRLGVKIRGCKASKLCCNPRHYGAL